MNDTLVLETENPSSYINTRDLKTPFKFLVKYKDHVLYERIFDSLAYNQNTRNNLNLKTLYHTYRDVIKTTLTTVSKNLTFEYLGYPLNPKYKKTTERFSYLNDKITKKSNNKEENIVKMVIYNNNNIVIERETVVNNLNPEAFNSYEFLCNNNDMVLSIENLLRNNDINQIFSEKELIDKHSLSIKDIRNLSEEEKSKLLK